VAASVCGSAGQRGRTGARGRCGGRKRKDPAGIELAYFGARSQREISLLTGISSATAKSRTTTAFKRSRTELAPEDAFREKAK